MKIAKKLLAAIVALMVVCSLTVSAFAAVQVSADAGAHIENADWEIVDDQMIVYLYLDKAVGNTASDFVLTYDSSIFAYSFSEEGADAAELSKCKNNTFTYEIGDTVEGQLEVAYYFKACLWTLEDFQADAKNKKNLPNINTESFEAIAIYFDLIDADKFNAENTEITLTGALKFAGVSDSTDAAYAAGADVPVNQTLSHIVASDEPATDAPATDAPATDAPATDAPATDAPATDAPATDAPATDAPATDAPATDAPATDAPATDAPATNPLTPPATEDPDSPIGGGDRPGPGGNGGHGGHGKPGHDHPNTGNSAVLAAAAGVVLLAGAAFVVTKKRK